MTRRLLMLATAALAFQALPALAQDGDPRHSREGGFDDGAGIGAPADGGDSFGIAPDDGTLGPGLDDRGTADSFSSPGPGEGDTGETLAPPDDRGPLTASPNDEPPTYSDDSEDSAPDPSYGDGAPEPAPGLDTFGQSPDPELDPDWRNDVPGAAPEEPADGADRAPPDDPAN